LKKKRGHRSKFLVKKIKRKEGLPDIPANILPCFRSLRLPSFKGGTKGKGNLFMDC